LIDFEPICLYNSTWYQRLGFPIQPTFIISNSWQRELITLQGCELLRSK
jgi:hypothetical protein